MASGAVARARLAVLPICALVVPWRCSLGPPLADQGEAVPRAVSEPSAPAPPAITERRAAQPLGQGPRDEQRPAPAVSAATEKREPAAQRISSLPPRARPAMTRQVTLPEEVVLKAMGFGQRQFLRCWARAQNADPGLMSAKVWLHLDIDAAGKVATVKTDTESPVLAGCLAGVARQLPFPAPGQPAVVDLPLMFP
jgi:hypothetical protein